MPFLIVCQLKTQANNIGLAYYFLDHTVLMLTGMNLWQQTLSKNMNKLEEM